ncbi:MAG: hypothetical protein R3B48_30485 [Kofleriaceae bacterium]
MSDSSGSPSGSWLPRALVLSAALHALVWGVGAVVSDGGLRRSAPETVDLELAPPAPEAEVLPEERPPEAQNAQSAQQAQQAAAPPLEPASEEGVEQVADAGPVDAPPDAAPDARPRRKKPKPDAAPDAALDAAPDSGLEYADAADAGPVDAAPDAGDAGDAPDAGDGGVDDGGAGVGAPQVAQVGDAGAGDGGVGDGGAGTGDGGLAVAAADFDGGVVDGGVVGPAFEAGLGNTPTSAGTASNLLAYVPAGHLVTALIRFDRLRGSRWAEPAERLLRPMPDYVSLFGDRDAKLVETFDTLVISSPRPRDPTATLLAGRSAMTRAQLRAFFAQRGTPISWSVVSGGALGTRTGGRVLPGDPRVIVSPTPSWFFLAAPPDLAGLTAPAKGNVDRAVARVRLPPWLMRVQTIDAEAGEPWGPALIVTVTATRARWKVPDLGLGVTSIPAPERGTVAMELVKQGWVVRGNVKFASEAEAEEFTVSVETVLRSVRESEWLRAALKRGHALNAILGLSVKRTGARVAYATSISIADTEAFLALAAAGIDDYFGRARRAGAPSNDPP